MLPRLIDINRGQQLDFQEAEETDFYWNGVGL